MKRNSIATPLVVASIFAISALATDALAEVTGANLQTVYTPTLPNGDVILGFDRDDANRLYYSFGNYADPAMGVARWDGTTQTSIYNSPRPGGDFPGGVDVNTGTAGTYLYFHRDNFPTAGFSRAPTTSLTVTNQTNVSPISSFTGLGDRMFVSGYGTGPALYVGDISTTDGSVSSLLKITEDLAGSSGPIAFDSDGNLYHAPGFSDKSIYKWTAAEVAAAISDPSTASLAAAGHLWLDYSADPKFASVSGASGLTFDQNGNLVATITSLSDPSLLVDFAVKDGAYDGSSILATSTTRLGNVQFSPLDNRLYFNDAQAIYSVPEPAALSVIALGSLLALRRRRS